MNPFSGGSSYLNRFIMAKKPVTTQAETTPEVSPEMREKERLNALRLEAIAPVNVIITPNKPELASAKGDAILVSNKLVGDIMEVFPFGEAIVLPRIIVNAIREARFVRVDETRSTQNVDSTQTSISRQLVPTYAVNEQPLAEEEKEKLLKGKA